MQQHPEEAPLPAQQPQYQPPPLHSLPYAQAAAVQQLPPSMHDEPPPNFMAQVLPCSMHRAKQLSWICLHAIHTASLPMCM
jgi:hypothetical protein